MLCAIQHLRCHILCILRLKTYYKIHYFFVCEIISGLSATLHLYDLHVWSNYGFGKRQTERMIMSNSNNNQLNIPKPARQAALRPDSQEDVFHTNCKFRQK